MLTSSRGSPANSYSDISLDEDISDSADRDENNIFHVYFNGNHEKMCIQKKIL